MVNKSEAVKSFEEEEGLLTRGQGVQNKASSRVHKNQKAIHVLA